MPYKVIHGTFGLVYHSDRRVGSRPDGDSLWFKPKNRNHLEHLGSRKIDYNNGGYVQLRFEAIDALELHYKGSHQHPTMSIETRDFLLSTIGFTDVKYSGNLVPKLTIASATPPSIPGYILTKDADPHARPISFVFTGSSDVVDGDETWLTPDQITTSLNAKLAKNGYVYPAFYTGLPVDLRNVISSLCDDARSNNLNVWSVDQSITGFQVEHPEDLEELSIWPKLYRRLTKFFKETSSNIGDFEGWLRSDPDNDDQIYFFKENSLGRLHNLLEIDENTIKMKYYPNQFMIVPK